MRVFFIDIEIFKTKIDKQELSAYADKVFKSEKRFYEHALGRYLVKNVAKNFYGVNDTQIILDDKGKPFFKNSDLFFSISHSGNLLVVCFDEKPCGIDIEKIKDKDISLFSKYFKIDFKDKYDFYKFWTQKEATYKLNSSHFYSYTTIFKKEYMITVVSLDDIENGVEIKEYQQ